jgi:hypothetical protein
MPEGSLRRGAGTGRAPRGVAAVLALSDERDLHEARWKAAWREGYRAGRVAALAEAAVWREAAWAPIRYEVLDPEMIDTITKAAAAERKRVMELRWGPGGRYHFSDPRPGDYQGGPVDFYGRRRS